MLGETEANLATTDLETDYEILGELGRGGSAVVYHARDRELGRDVAIKVIRPRFAEDDDAVARLAREARTVAQLQHPNIVTLYAVRRLRDGGLALVMQRVPGRTLRDLLNERGPLTFERADRVLRDVAAALAHAHARGIVHRDVKPENIFLDETTGHALLSDFGIARSLETDSQVTVTGMAIGTPAYMSPEQIDGASVDGRSDLYSLGLVGWEMISGRRPWDGEGLYNVIYKQKREELPPLDELRPDTPDRLLYLIEGAIRKRPAERWSSAADYLERASMIAPEGGWRRWHAERRKRRKAVVYAAARQRGDSMVSAALATVRFDRAAALERGVPRPNQDPAASATGSADGPAPIRNSEFAGTLPPDFAVADGDRAGRGRRRAAGLLVAAALVSAAVLGGRYILGPGPVSPPAGASSPSLTDRRGVEVPIAAPALPRPASADSALLAAGGDAALADSSGSSAVQAPAADTSAATTPAGQPVRGGGLSANAAATTDSSRSERTTSSRASAGGASDSAGGRRPEATPIPPRSTAAASGESLGMPPSVGTLPAPPAVAPTPPRAVVSFPTERGTIAAGGRHSCALGEGGTARCWGANDRGQLGDGGGDGHAGPLAVAGDLAFTSLSAGSSHTCGVTREGDAYCWGNNERGQLGDATTLQRDTPVRVSGSWTFQVVRTGLSHSCGLARGGTVVCWGSNTLGQLGTAGGLASARAAEVLGSHRFGALATGWNHTCAIATDGTLYCWGSNVAGQLGDGTREDRRTPTRVTGDQRFMAVAAGTQHTCALSTSGEAYCWGKNSAGQLGMSAGDRPEPTRVESPVRFASIAAGAVHTCARTSGGEVYCWGKNNFGQLGDGTTTDRAAPTRVSGAPSVVALHASGSHTCAATGGGETYCWGYNIEGQLGDGTRNHRSRPVSVSIPSR